MVLIVSIVKVAKKADEIITRIGLNPAITGSQSTLPGVILHAVLQTGLSMLTRGAASGLGSVLGFAGKGKSIGSAGRWLGAAAALGGLGGAARNGGSRYGGGRVQTGQTNIRQENIGAARYPPGSQLCHALRRTEQNRILLPAVVLSGIAAGDLDAPVIAIPGQAVHSVPMAAALAVPKRDPLNNRELTNPAETLQATSAPSSRGQGSGPAQQEHRRTSGKDKAPVKGGGSVPRPGMAGTAPGSRTPPGQKLGSWPTPTRISLSKIRPRWNAWSTASSPISWAMRNIK